jgi:hypothetical protein
MSKKVSNKVCGGGSLGKKKVKAARRASWGVLERAPFSAGDYSGFLLDDLGNPT